MLNSKIAICLNISFNLTIFILKESEIVKKGFSLLLIFSLVLSMLIIFSNVTIVLAQEENVKPRCLAIGGSPECCNQVPFDIDSPACQADLNKGKDKQFTYPEATETYQSLISCFDKKGYAIVDAECNQIVLDISTIINNENNKCLSQCYTNKPGSSNCDTCVNAYSSGGYTERTYSSCDSFCLEKSPGQCGECFDLRDKKKKEINFARDSAVSDWQEIDDLVRTSVQEKKIETLSDPQETISAYTKEDGNLKEMEEMLKADTGSDSDVSKTLDECEQSKQDIINRCQQSPEGWNLDISISVNDLESGKNYQFQDYRTGGCKKSQKFREPINVKIESRLLSAADSSQKGQASKNKQVSCSMRCSSWNCDDTYMALVDSYKGQASIIKNGVSVAIGKDTPVQEGDTIITGEGGEVSFKLVGGEDKSYVEIKPNSKLKIIDPEVGAEIIKGDAKTHIEKGSNRKYTITTPAARINAKGTDFLVSVEADTGKTDVYLYEGTLQIVQLLTNEYITINSNEKVTVDAQALGTPIKISDEKAGPVSDTQPESKTTTVSSDKAKGSSSIIFILAILIMAGIAGGAYYFLKIKKKINEKEVDNSKIEKP